VSRGFDGGGADESSPPPDDAALGKGELQDRAVRGVTWTVINVAVALPVGFLVNLVVARVLGVVDYGRLAYLTVVMDVVSGIVMMGATPALVQFGSKAHAAGRRDEVAALMSKVQGFRVLVAAPVLTVVVLLLVSDVDPWFKLIAVVFGVLLPAALDGAPAGLAIENKTAAGAKVVLVSSLLTQAAVLGAVLVVARADVVWAVRLIMLSVTVLLSLVPLAPAYRRAVLRPRLPSGLPAGFWPFALPAGAAALVSNLVVSRTEVVALTWLSDATSVGVFALAFGLAGHLFAPAQAVVGPLVPAISGLREVDVAAVAAAFGRTVRATSTVVALLTGVGLPVVTLLVPAFYGASFEGVPPILLALGVANGFLIVGGPVAAFVMARLSGSRVLLASLVALAVDVALAVGLIPFWGAWGAVVANVSAAATQMLVLLVAELRALGLSWGVVLRDAVPALVGAVVAVGAWLAGRPISSVLLAAIVAGLIGLAAVVLLLGVLRSGLTDGDLRGIVRVLPGRLQTGAGAALRWVRWRPEVQG
jgi:O-antigen/teichoic acid export membrane protein